MTGGFKRSHDKSLALNDGKKHPVGKPTPLFKKRGI
jgi:hypothetical protein